MNRGITWVLLIALAVAACALMSGCPDEGGISEEGGAIPQMGGAQPNTGGAGKTPPPAATGGTAGEAADTKTDGAADDAAATPPADDAGKAGGEETKSAGGAKAGGEAAQPAESSEASESKDQAEGKDSGAKTEQTPGGPAAPTGAATAEEAGQTAAKDAAAEEEAAAEPTTEDRIENFKNLDPREIIDKKYDDLAGRETTPWNEDDPESFIPETGRVDPLTRVSSVVPDELKPPRAGETDQNQIDSYLVARAASEAVAGIAMSIQCHNVIQIGLDKYASFSIEGGGNFTLQEGMGSGQFFVGSVNGIPLVGEVTCASISTSQVVLTISVAGYGTPTSISKNQIYIPRNRF